MTSNRKRAVCIALCLTAILVIAVSGCDDLGAYSDTKEYYSSLGDIVFVGGAAGDGKGYSVKDYFYNDDSREDFLTSDDGEYHGVKHSDYVYVGIPFEKDIKMDSLAMYVQAKSDVTVYIDVYWTDEKPGNWKNFNKADTDGETSTDTAESDLESNLESNLDEASAASDTTETEKLEDPTFRIKIDTVTLHLKAGAWNSFLIDSFKINDKNEKSIYVEKGQYILLHIRNNTFDEEQALYVDTQTDITYDRAEITMTNLLVRALEQ